MRTVLLALAVGLVACGKPTDDEGPLDTEVAADTEAEDTDVVDTLLDDTDEVACDPLGAPGDQGCDVGQKCAWVSVTETPTALGELACVPDGTVALGGVCAQGPIGETTGYDDCAAGGVCIAGTCREVCSATGDPAGPCATGACTRYADLFANGEDDPAYGACTPGCDPLTQERDEGGTCGEGQGCYVLVGTTDTIAVCGGAGTPVHGEAISGGVFANSCAPGHISRPRATAPTQFECAALCEPADVTSTENAELEGGVSPYTCEAKGAPAPDDATAGESCRYFWLREPFEGLSRFSNTLGVCRDHVRSLYDSNGDTTPDAPLPRCTTLTTGDLVPPIANPPHNDALYFGCLALPVSARGGGTRPPRVPAPRLDRLVGWR